MAADPHYQDIRDRLRNLSDFAKGIIPHQIAHPCMEPELSDAHALQEDLQLLAAKVDAVVLAYGEYCRNNGILSAQDVKDCFTDQVSGALEGNALYLIEAGVIERQQYFEDAEVA